MRVELLRSKMALLGITQNELAVKTGIKKNTLSSRMTGKSSFRLGEVDRICAVLSINSIEERAEIFLS